jgi:hypothetical protein
MPITVAPMIRDVRRALDEVTLTGELTVFAAGMQDLLSAEFSEEDIEDRLLDGARYVAARVRAAHLRELHMTINPTSGVLLNTTSFYRMLGTRVAVSGKTAQRRTLRSHTRIEDGGGRAATANEPAYVFEDFEFVANAGTGDYSSDDRDGSNNPILLTGAAAVVVRVPTFDGATFNGVNWSGSTKTLAIDGRMREAIIQYAVASCFMTKAMRELALAARQNMNRELQPYFLPVTAKEGLKKE